MKILSITLHRYERFPFIGQDTVRIDFTKKLNILKGTNGSGKSSLMQELSPLPSSRDDFSPGGFKIIEIEHKGKIYTLESNFKDTPRYSFTVDEENLNPAGLLSIQKELVAQHFSLRPELYEIFSGQKFFTKMTVAERRKLFQILSDSNIDYVMKEYSRLQGLLKDKNQLIIHYLKKKEIESAKCLSLEKRDEVESTIKVLKEKIDALLKFREQLEIKGSPSSDKEVILQLCDVINIHYEQFYPWISTYSGRDHTRNATIVDLRREAIKKELGTLFVKLDEVDKSITQIQKTQGHEEYELVGDIKAINERIAGTLKNILYVDTSTPFDFQSVNDYVSRLNQDWPSIISELPDNSNREYGREALFRLTEQKERLINERQLCKNGLENTRDRIDHQLSLQKEANVNCPECGHQFPPFFNAKKLTEDQEKLERYSRDLTTLETQLSVVIEKHEFVTRCVENYKNLFSYKSSAPSCLKPFWDSLLKDNIVTHQPGSIIGMLNRLTLDIERSDAIQKDKENLETQARLLKDVRDNSLTNLSYLTETQRELNARIKELRVEEDLLVEAKRHYQVFLTWKEIYTKQMERLETLIKEHEGYVSNELNREIRAMIQDEIRQSQLKLVELESLIENERLLARSLEDCNEKLDEFSREKFVLNTMIDSLSPRTGLIAKSIGGFINVLIHSMNKIIKQIWTYPFEIIPYQFDDGEKLDYRFKIRVNDQKEASDISKSSSGMGEVVDLSLPLTVMQILGMQNYPIYLDEFGIRLDAQHRANVYGLITSLLLDSNYSQIFLVSHQDTGFANPKDTDVIILDVENIDQKDQRNSLRIY